MNVPFVANSSDNTHCLQAALNMVLKAFQPGLKFTWEELDRFTAKIEGLWTWPYAGLLWLSSLGFEVISIEAFDNAQFSARGYDYLLKEFGKEYADEQDQHSNLQQERRLAEEFVQKANIDCRIPTLDDVRLLLAQGYLLICNVNSCTLNGQPGYTGHFVVLTEISADSVVLHDPGLPPQPNRKISLQTFVRAWAYPNEKAKNVAAFKSNTRNLKH